MAVDGTITAENIAEEAIAGARTHYGRVTAEQGMVKLIDPRKN